MNRLGPEFYARTVLDVAPDLLNKVLVVGPCRVRIVETEAYRGDDPASHSYGGPTRRNGVMFGQPGRLYVYFVYGMHHCANVVTGALGDASAVLIRGAEVVDGEQYLRRRRPVAGDATGLVNGPAKLCQALGLDLRHNGLDLNVDVTTWIGDDGVPPPGQVARSPRIGISRGRERLWRFYVPGSAGLSRPSVAQPG